MQYHYITPVRCFRGYFKFTFDEGARKCASTLGGAAYVYPHIALFVYIHNTVILLSNNTVISPPDLW